MKLDLKIEIGKKTQTMLVLLLLAGVVGAVSEFGNNVVISGWFSGDGGNITGLNASKVSSGTLNILVTNIAGGPPFFFPVYSVGMQGTFVDPQATQSDETVFWCSSNICYVKTSKNYDIQQTTISNIANNTLLTIMATSSTVKYYVDGSLVATHTNSPTEAMYVGAQAENGPTTLDVDYMDIEVYR